MQFLKRCFVVAVILLCVIPMSAARADGPRDRDERGANQRGRHQPQMLIESPFQVLVVDGVEFGFEARVAFCADHQPRARTRGFGFVELTSSDGDVLQLVPVWGTVDWKNHGAVLTFVPNIDREIGPEDLVVAIVQPSPHDPNCDLWDLTGTESGSGVLPPPFEAEGSMSLTRRGGECEPVDYGQLDAWVLIDTPLQPVMPLPPSDIAGIDALIGLDRNQAARGYLDVYLPRGEPVSYEPIFAAAFPGEEEIIIRVAVVLLLADRQAPLNTNDHLLRATVTIDQTNPDCLIWDLINGESGPVNGTFDALGDIAVWPPRGRRIEIRGR